MWTWNGFESDIQFPQYVRFRIMLSVQLSIKPAFVVHQTSDVQTKLTKRHLKIPELVLEASFQSDLSVLIGQIL